MPALGLAAAVAAAFALALTWTGTEWSVAVIWLVTLLVGVVVPGTCLVRGLRRRAGSLDDDVVWGSVAGLILVLLAWFAGHLAGVQLPQLVVGLVVTALVLAVPASRRRVLARSLPTWGAVTSAVVAAAALFTLRVAQTTGLSYVPPHVAGDGPRQLPDLWYHLALTGELRRTMTPTYPLVAGEPLSYHWFYYAVAAQLGGNGVHDLDVVLRLLPTTLLVQLVLVAATVGRLVVGRRAGAGGAALMVGVVGPVGGSLWAAGLSYGFPSVSIPPILSPLRTYWQWSPTQTLAWVFGLAAVGLLIALVRLDDEDRSAPLWLLLPVLFGAAGAKSVQNPLLAGGLAVVGLASIPAIVRGGRPGRMLLARGAGAVAAIAVCSVGAARLLYPQSYGLRVVPPGRGLADLVVWIAPGLTSRVHPTMLSAYQAPRLAELAAFVVMVLPCLVPLMGAGLLLRHARTRLAGWMALGMGLAGLAGMFLFTHPGRSQIFFVVGMVPMVGALAGAGVGTAVADWVGQVRWHGRSWAAPARQLAPVLSVGVVAAAVTVAVTLWAGALTPTQRWRASLGHDPRAAEVSVSAQSWAWARPFLAIGLGIVAAAVVGVAVHRWLNRRTSPAAGGRVLAGLALAAAVAGAVGALPLALPGADPYPPQLVASQRASDRATGTIAPTPALEQAGQLVRSMAEPDDVVATNLVYIRKPTSHDPGDNRNFYVSALTGLRTDVSGFGYADRMQLEASTTETAYTVLPFWDPPRLAAEQRLISSPTASDLARAYRRGVRWVVADEQAGPVSPALASLTTQVFDRGGVHAYRLRAG